jgi:serpin B
LKELGASLPFSETGADFSGITGVADLFISKVVHQAVLEVNEEGVEAAAATSMMIGITCIMEPEPEPVEFICDRPFLFFITDNIKNSILFMGKFSEPVELALDQY